MPTGDKTLYVYNKVLVSEQKLGLYFLDFLRGMIDDTTRAAFLQSGVLDDETIGLESSTNDTFTLNITNAERVMDDQGHIVDLGNVAAALYENYPFANANTVVYYVGIRYQSVPSGLELNPRTTEPEYSYLEESLGELDNPDSVTDNTTYIRLMVTGMLESGVDHSGRPVTVWLENPVASTEADAYYEGVVEYSAPNNYIEIPYTGSAGPLGQTTPTFPISTNASDYLVQVNGVSWFKDTDLRSEANYAFIGTVTGNGPAATPVTFDITDQRPTFLISLDRAYRANSAATPAPGRKIWTDKWAIELIQGATVQRGEDPGNMAFRIDKLSETITGGIGIGVFGSWQDHGSFPFSMMMNAADAASGGDLQPLEDVDLVNPGTITFNRGAIDLTTTIEDIIRNAAVVWITGTASNTQDGLYIIESVASSSSITVLNLDGTSPAFSGESNVNCQWFMFTSAVIHRDPFASSYTNDQFSHLFSFFQGTDGIEVKMRGTPQGDNVWAMFSLSEGDNANEFCAVRAGRIVMRGGGEARIGQNLLGGLPQFAVDKVDIANMDSNWQPAEYEDWGFDYRGDSYGKETSTDDPAFALSGTFRSPSWSYQSGAQDWDPEEPFSQYAVNILTLTGAGDIEKLMGDPVGTPQSSPGMGWFLVEVRYDGGNATDGIYLLRDVDVANTRITLMKLDGTTPAFPSGDGDIRIFGGSMVGPIYGSMDTVNAWMHQITCPTPNTGGLRISSGWGAMQFLTASVATPPGLVDFYIKGGKTFATALTTRQATVASLPAAGAMEASAMYPGGLHLTSTGPDDILLPDTLGAATDRIKRESGSTWQYWQAVDVRKGHPMDNSGTLSWYLPSGSSGDYWLDQAAATQAFHVTPLFMPHGATLNQVESSLTAMKADGTSGAMGIDIRRMTWSAASSVSLSTGGIVRPSSGGGSQNTHVFSCDQNNVIDNTQYTYWLWLEGSDTAGDRIWGARMQLTVTALGQSLFDAH